MTEKINLNKNKESAFVNELNKIIDSPRDFRPAHIEVILQQVSDKELLGLSIILFNSFTNADSLFLFKFIFSVIMVCGDNLIYNFNYTQVMEAIESPARSRMMVTPWV